MGRRIIFTVTNDLAFDQRMQRICGSLAAAGYAVTLVGRLKNDSRSLTSQPYQQVRLKHLLFGKGKLFYLEFNIRLLFYLLFVQTDAICSIDLDTAIPGILVAKLRKKHHVFDAHELFTHVPEVERRKRVQAVWSWVQRFTFKHTNAAYTVGPAIAEYFEALYQRPVKVVRNMPIATDSMPSDSSATNPFSWLEDKRFILYQGALNEGRGLEALIDAMKSIPCELVAGWGGRFEQGLARAGSQSGTARQNPFFGNDCPATIATVDTDGLSRLQRQRKCGFELLFVAQQQILRLHPSAIAKLGQPLPRIYEIIVGFPSGIAHRAQYRIHHCQCQQGIGRCCFTRGDEGGLRSSRRPMAMGCRATSLVIHLPTTLTQLTVSK